MAMAYVARSSVNETESFMPLYPERQLGAAGQ